MIEPGRWQFDFSEPLLVLMSVVLLFSLLLVLNSVIKRLFKRAPLRSLAVMALNFIAYASVLLLLLEPRFLRPLEQTVTLVTEGADFQVFGLVDSARLYVAPGVDATAAKQHLNRANWLLDIGQLPQREPALEEIKLHGFGLDHDQWQVLPDQIQIDFNPPPVYGFTAMRWQRRVVEGETMVVSGRFLSPGPNAVTELRLLDPAGNIAGSTRVKSGQGFSLPTYIKARGNLEFRLQAWHEGIKQSEQLLPLESVMGAPLNIMIRQSAPSFETRALSNDATIDGHKVRINTDISKGKTLEQSINLPRDADTSLSPAVLAEQDLLIMDGRALADLPITQRQWLDDSIEKGLGLLVLADSTLLQRFDELNTDLLAGFHLSPLPGTEPMVYPRLLTRYTEAWQQPLQTDAMSLDAGDADVLVDDGNGRSLVIRQPKGQGHIGITLINHSHTWLTSGQRAAWGEYWSAVSASLARQSAASYLLPQAETAFYREDEKAEICALTAEMNARVVIQANTPRETSSLFKLQLAADNLNSPLRCVYFWPEAGGWHRLQMVSGDSGDILDQKAIYVFTADQWLAQQRDQRVQATQAMAFNGKTRAREAPAKWVSVPIDPFWLWLALMLSATILWLERKLDIA